MHHSKIIMLICAFIVGSGIASPVFPQDLLLPDSGQELCYDWDSIICSEWDSEGEECLSPYCPSIDEDFYGQDGSYTINSPSLTDNGDGTIKDNLTGLTWEQKTEENEPNLHTHAEAISYCEDLVLGGSDAWRIPTRKEYSTILNYGVISPSLDHAFFPYYTASNRDDIAYWTVSEYYDDSTQVWKMSIPFGLIDAGPKEGVSNKVRCVRGSPLPASNFVDNGDGTVTDFATGLMWEQKTVDGSSRDKDTVRTWNDALSYCENLELAGFTDWRLPNTKELERIVDIGTSAPATDQQFFPNTNNALYWTGTSCAGCHKFKALSIDFTDGELYFGVKFRDGEYHEHNERCVRTADISTSNDTCPINTVLQNDGGKLAPFRAFRDRVLAKSAKGRVYIKKYYGHSSEITHILLSGRKIKIQAAKILAKALPSLTTAVNSGTVTISQKIITEIESFLDVLETQASLSLKETIQEIRKDLRGNTLLNQLGVVIR
jgi:hypothetical protein